MTTDAPAFETPLPHDPHAERIVIGAIISSRGALDEVTDILDEAAFHVGAHGTIYAAARALADSGAPISPVSVAAELTRRGDATRVGGAPYLFGCVDDVPSIANAGFYARIVADRARLRALALAADTARQLAYDAKGDADEILDQARTLVETATAPPGSADLPALAEWLPAWVDSLEQGETVGLVAPPYRDLRDYLPGWRPGQLVVIAARPGVGKSTMAMDAARKAAIADGHPVLFCSLEMPREELAARMMAAESRVSLRAITDHTLTESEWERFGAALSRVVASPLTIDDTPGATLARIRGRLRHMARTDPARLVIVDYLGLISGPPAESRQQEVAAIARGLKSIAREFEVPVLALAQMNRAVEGRQSKRPVLSDLRESGQIEAEADVVAFLHRPDADDKESDRSGELDLIIQKNRNGPTGEVTVASQLHYARCVDLAQTALPMTPDAA